MTFRSSVPIGPMSRRQLLTVLIATPVLASFLQACGSATPEGTSDGTTPGTSPTDPSGPEELVLRIEYGRGAFTTPQLAFREIPSVLLTADGTAITPGPQIEIYPPPLLPSLQRSTFTPQQIDSLTAKAEALGLLATPPDYREGAPMVEDAGSTVVTLAAGGATYEHVAPALNLTEETVPARRDLAEFVAFVEGFVTGAEDQQWVVHEPERFVLSTIVVNNSDYTGDVAPTVLPWPPALGEPPASGTCVDVDGATIRAELAGANELTFFDVSEAIDGSTLVQPLVRPVLPGGSAAC